MNENAKQWVAALRSGEWEQGKRYLGQAESANPKPEDFKFCCLGVACELAIRAGVPIKRTEHVEWNMMRMPTTFVSYDGDVVVMPPLVREWLGLRFDNGSLANPVTALSNLSADEDIRLTNLANVNDFTAAGFSGIADIIEAEPLGLFKK